MSAPSAFTINIIMSCEDCLCNFSISSMGLFGQIIFIYYIFYERCVLHRPPSRLF